MVSAERATENSQSVSVKKDSKSQMSNTAGSATAVAPSMLKPMRTPMVRPRRALKEVVVNQTDKINANADANAKVDAMTVIEKIPRVRREISDLTYVSLKKRHIYVDRDAEDENADTLQEKKKIKPIATIDEDRLENAEENWRDLDILEKNDICMVYDYTDDIFDHLYHRELETTPEKNYVTDSSATFTLRPSMRAILVDWLVEVHEKFECYPETLFLSINLMDRFLSKNKVTLSKLQLLAVTSLFIAAKFEEINLPKLSDYAYITDGAASTQDIKTAEMFMLTSLQFNIGWPNPMNFIRRISKADGYDHETRSIAKMLVEFTLCCHRFINVKPSFLSAVSMYIARRVTNKNKNFWDNTFKHYSGGIDALTDSQFQNCCKELIEEIADPTTSLQSLLQKFKHQRYGPIYDKVKNWCHTSIESDYKDVFPI